MFTSYQAITGWQARRWVLAVLLGVTLAAPATAAVGDLDPTFGVDGAILLGRDGIEFFLSPAIVQEDGGLLLGGLLRVEIPGIPPDPPRQEETVFVRHQEADGRLDGDFGSGGLARVAVGPPGTLGFPSLAAAPDGGTVIAIQDRSTGASVCTIARLDLDGQPDPGFGIAGRTICPLTQITAPVLVLPDGGILLAGDLSGTQRALVRLNADGTLDGGFGEAGVAILEVRTLFGSSARMRLAVQADGRIVIVTIEAGRSIHVIRREVDGTLDPTFAGGDIANVLGEGLLDVALRPDGRIVVATTSRRLLAQAISEHLVNLNVLDTNGMLEANAGGPAGPVVTAINGGLGVAGVFQSDGKLVLVEQGPESIPVLLRVNPDGSADAGLGRRVVGADVLQDVFASFLVLGRDGTVVMTGGVLSGLGLGTSAAVVARIQGIECGNGSLESGESCDEGALRNGAPDSCCTATCAAAPDADGDGRCDAQDPCTDVDGERGFGTKSTLVLRRPNREDTTDDRLALQARLRLPVGTTFSDLDPEADGLRLLLADAAGVQLLDVTLPPGAIAGAGTRGWRLRAGGRRWVYRDLTDARLGGIHTVRIVARGATAAGEITVTVRGARGSYPVQAEIAPLAVTLVLGSQLAAEAGQCGEQAFAASSCSFDSARQRVTCAQS